MYENKNTTEYDVFNDPYFESKLVNKVPTSKKTI